VRRPPPSLAGLILAGGRSSRFGGDKAAAMLDGRSLLQIAALALQGTGAPVAVSAPVQSKAAQLAADLGLAVLPDWPGDPAGPLAGLRAGLEWAQGLGAGRLALRPVDTPFLPLDLYDRLEAVLDQAPAAFCVTADGLQPLCSLWTPAALSPLRAALAGGRHPPVHTFLERIGAARLAVEDSAAFANINTPDDLARLQDRAGSRDAR
jgi:molybdopterin-guanine dinucleotide biosynthesis protein A